MNQMYFPARTGGVCSAEREAPLPCGTVLVVTTPNQRSLPNLGVAGLRATFSDGAVDWNRPPVADLLLFCAGEAELTEIHENLHHAQAHGIPVIIWGQLATDERIAMLERGVQEVISQDCHPLEFQARLQVQLRRRLAAVKPAVWRLSVGSRVLIAPDGAVLQLSSGLMALLQLLLEGNGEVVERDELARAFYERLTNRALDAQVCRLRRKLTDHGCRIRLQGVKGLGYSLRFEDGPVLIEFARGATAQQGRPHDHTANPG